MQGRVTLCLSMIVGAAALGGRTATCYGEAVRLVPPVKQVEWSSRVPLSLTGQSPAIVIGDRASEPEQYAAERLQATLARRFNVRCSIVRPNDDAAQKDTVIILGQRGTNRWLDELCAKHGIKLPKKPAGHDGYAIEMLDIQGRTVVLVAGSNSRAVIYGQDTLFQMFTDGAGELQLTRASIRDWASVPWRGRPQTSVSHYLRAGELDCFMASRINFIDIREGIYAFEPGAKLDEKTIRQAIEAAHRRGLLIYGTVNCGVLGSAYDNVLKTFKDLIALGADGLWLSFDDKGPGQFPEQLVFNTLQLGRQYNMTDYKIAITPPKGSYQTIDDDSNGDFNRKIMAVPGMEKAIWFWTRIPSPEALREARGIGLKTGLGWWHNWTRPGSGFSHFGGGPQYSKGKRSYMEVPSMAEGWHRPSYEQLARADQCTAAVMPWGGNAWGQYYIVPPIGWWAWYPKNHNWEATRSRIYDIVYGPNQVEAARAYDNILVEAKKYLAFTARGSKWESTAPARLQNPADRDTLLALLAKLKAPLQQIEQGAARQTLIDVEQCEQTYVGAMRTELETARAIASMDYPEYWWPEYQRKILSAIYDGDMAKADRLASEARPRLLREVADVDAKLSDLQMVPHYVHFWTRLANLDAKGWRALLAERRSELAPNVWRYSYFVVITSNMIKNFSDPPLRWGTGGATGHNRLLATVLPTEQEQFWGQWLGGLYEENGIQAAVFCFDDGAMAATGDYSELPVNIPLSGDRNRLGLMLCMSSKNTNRLGLEEAIDRWAGYRYIELLWGDRLLWEADAGRTRIEGEWSMIELPPIPQDISMLPLRLRIVDRQPDGIKAIVFVSPIYVIEMERQGNEPPDHAGD